jgi:hypothetical protein
MMLESKENDEGAVFLYMAERVKIAYNNWWPRSNQTFSWNNEVSVET